MSVLRTLVLIIVASMALPAAAADPQLLLQRFVDGVRSLSAQFVQVQYDESGAELDRRSGDFILSRPGRFRWNYTQPYQQLMVCDGEQIWNYEPDLDQVTVRPAGRVLQDTPAALLAQGGQLSERFALEDGGRDGGAQIVRLRPKAADTDFSLIELWLEDRGVPQRIRFHDALGGTTDVQFTAINTTAIKDLARFTFTPPAGAEVVRLEDSGG
jgi:outer membrane lipoprotein carrier protein